VIAVVPVGVGLALGDPVEVGVGVGDALADAVALALGVGEVAVWGVPPPPLQPLAMRAPRITNG